ncbi:hypothetical protein [Chryseobacterium sp. AG363]|uniref:hypothetical protein n=1 Tax=Chryseobacterium sp. AG363 TaxID=2183997 RepID=UPI000E736EDC|nr:hypothetical protein [Chryseobacterium sp. AG363]RKE77877.1 hypothetical protein DEU39_3510 [Chryseobacterium sp. AG363]
MKKIFISVCILLGISCLSQTTTKKFNSFQNRYEYFDSNGNMIGYEKYNSFSKQWEYYTTNNTSQSRQPTQYRDPQQLDISALGNTMETKQNNYNYNVQQLQNSVNNIVEQINNLDLPDEQKQAIYQNFQQQCVNELNRTKINYSSANETNRIIKWLYDSLNIIIKKAQASNTKSFNSDQNNYSNANAAENDNNSSVQKSKKDYSNSYFNMYDQNFRELDVAAKKNYDKIKHTLIANVISKSYKENLDEFYSLAERFELNEANSKKLYNDVLYNVVILDNLANSYHRVKRITYFNSKNSIVKDSNDLNSYLMIDSKFVHFKTATNIENYRDLTDKTYNPKKSGSEYKSKYGAIFIPDDLTYVKFYDSQDFSGSYYIYYISK